MMVLWLDECLPLLRARSDQMKYIPGPFPVTSNLVPQYIQFSCGIADAGFDIYEDVCHFTSNVPGSRYLPTSAFQELSFFAIR